MLTSSLYFGMCVQTLPLRCTRGVSLQFERKLIFISCGHLEHVLLTWCQRFLPEVIRVAETRERYKPLSGLSFLENAPLGNGVLLCALLSFLLLLVSRSSTGLVRFLCIAFPTCIRTGALCFLMPFCFFFQLRRLWAHAVFKHIKLGAYLWSATPC